jgi:hypothetical protein
VTHLIGTAVEIATGTITDSDSVAVDPSTLSLTIRKPDSSTVVVALGGWTRDGVGRYHYDYLPDQTGNHSYYVVATAPNVSFEGDFDVQASAALTPPTGFQPDPLIVDPARIVRLLNLPAAATPVPGTDAWGDVVSMIEDMQGLLSSILGRPLSVQTGTETVYAGAHGKVRLTRTPIVSINAVTVVDPLTDLSSLGVYGDTWDAGFGSSFDATVPLLSPSALVLADAVTAPTLLAGVYAPGTGFSVTYTAGLDGANEPALRNMLTLGCRRKIKAWLEDTEGLQGVRLGSGEGYQFDRLVSTQTPPQFAAWWTDDELSRVSSFSRRVIG